jgi:hypothetical protein
MEEEEVVVEFNFIINTLVVNRIWKGQQKQVTFYLYFLYCTYISESS